MPVYVNHVTLGGYLGKEPELVATKTGQSLLKFQLATNEKFGDNEQRTYWHSIVAWGYLADWAASHLRRGVYCVVTGHLHPTKFKSKTGAWIYANDITADTISTASKEDAAEQEAMAANARDEKEQADDLPF